MDYIKEFQIKLTNLDKSRNNLMIFRDFLTLSTYALSQPFYRSKETEQRYKNLIATYTKEQAEEFSQLLALLVLGLEQKHRDFLGEVFMQSDFGKGANGQYFTPYRISKMMSQMTGFNVKKYAGSEIMTLCEPCCGSGAMAIAFAESLLEQGINYQHTLFVEATDIDELCYKMTYIQLSILGIPAKVIWGDSLSMRFNECLYTPFYFLGGFKEKIEARNKFEKINENEPTKIIPEQTGQLTLFNYL